MEINVQRVFELNIKNFQNIQNESGCYIVKNNNK